MNLERFVHRMPKVELHVHLEGSWRPATLLRLAARRGVELPATDEAALLEWFRFRDFEHFVEVYLLCSRVLRYPEDFQLLLEDFAAGQAEQNVVYSEVHFTVSTHLANGARGDELAEALGESIAAVRRRLGVEIRLIPDIVRNVDLRRADETLEWALAARRHGVVALGLSGFESSPSEPFREHFEIAGREGLGRVAHAGEHGGPDSIRSVLDALGVDRIGHGVRAVEDPVLVERLAAERVPLEICPTSNVSLGVAPSLTLHPFDRLWRAGVPVTVNSDDPPLFGTTLSREYLGLARAFGYGAAEMATLSLVALEHAYLPPDTRAGLRGRFESEMDELGRELLGAAVLPSMAEGGAPSEAALGPTQITNER